MSAGSDLRLIAGHELRLAWRDFHSMMTARRRWKTRTVVMWGLFAIGFLHLVAYGMIKPLSDGGFVLDRDMLVPLAGSLALTFAVMLSQAIEQVTRVFYARGDLDLLLSSPVDAGAVSAVRIGAIAVTSGAMTTLAAAPFIHVMALLNGVSWLCAYLVLPSLAMSATALAVLVTHLLFETFGARRTRLIAQVVAAVIGAIFIVGVNLAAVFSIQGYSRSSSSAPEAVMAHAPAEDSPLVARARALAGESAPLVLMTGIGLALLGGVILFMRQRFARLSCVPRLPRRPDAGLSDVGTALPWTVRRGHFGKRNGCSCAAIHGLSRNRSCRFSICCRRRRCSGRSSAQRTIRACLSCPCW
ncbi:MAG: hypothetical protein R3C97_11810 [Geminicoccaceae bacterium]